jgi:hypothetical protein
MTQSVVPSFVVFFFFNQTRDNALFYKKVLWPDECLFTNRKSFNPYNHRYWSDENEHISIEQNPQRRFSVNVWCGPWVRHIIIEL